MKIVSRPIPPGTTLTALAIKSVIASRTIMGLLDVGCGNAVVTRLVCEGIPFVTAVDSSPLAIEQARLTLADRVLNGSARIV